MTLAFVIYVMNTTWEHFAPHATTPTMLECAHRKCEPSPIQPSWIIPAPPGRSCPQDTVPVPIGEDEFCLPPNAAEGYLRALREASGAP